MHYERLRKDLRRAARKRKAKVLASFFKTAPGEYASGDIFLGVSVPELRALAKKYPHFSLAGVNRLIKSPIHEERLCALLFLIRRYEGSSFKGKEEVYRNYLSHIRYINNWDLVDLTAPVIVGDFLLDKPKKPLYRLARSSSLWERRISIVSTHAFIRKGRFDDTLRIATLLLDDSHDLIHKAVGWMLREVGKRDERRAEIFLKKYFRRMPRTMLRYAIERFPEEKRKKYLKRV
jgi:3-methyladenine DNA glycosylase AlkD